MRETLDPRERIRKKKDFLNLYKKGNRYRGKYFTLIHLSSDSAFSRVGVVASRKVGSAVTRNRVKRWMRELFRRNKELLAGPVDLLIVALPAMREAAWKDVREEYLIGLKSLAEKRKT